MWLSTARPNLGWGRPIAAVFVGLCGPAVPAGLFLWLLDTDIAGLDNGALRAVWFVAACLTAAPLLAWVALPIATPLVRIMARRGWAGPGSLVALALLVGLPLAHILLNGDLTREAPAMIPILATALGLQALCGWIILRGYNKVQTPSVARPSA